MSNLTFLIVHILEITCLLVFFIMALIFIKEGLNEYRKLRKQQIKNNSTDK